MSEREYTDTDREVVMAALQACGGDESRAAKFCGIPVKMIRQWLLEEGVQRPAFIAPGRPSPPAEAIDPYNTATVFAPAIDMVEWIKATFLADESPLRNADHEHLLFAEIGVLWTNEPCRRGMKNIAGTAEVPTIQGNAWTRGRMMMQLTHWFGLVPDFLITLHAPYAAQVSDAQFCALVEHELYHCAQKETEFGCVKFGMDGRPQYGIKSHDVEEFVGIVRRYGVGQGAGQTSALVHAASFPAEVSDADISVCCGTCARSIS